MAGRPVGPVMVPARWRWRRTTKGARGGAGGRGAGAAGRLLEADQIGGDQAVENLAGLEGRMRGRVRDGLDRTASVDLGKDQPLARVEVDLTLASLGNHELGDEVHRRNLLLEDPPLVEAACRLHQQIGVRLRDGVRGHGRAGLEEELAPAPDRELVDRLLAREILDLGVNDLAFLDVDLTLHVAVGQVKTPGLSRRRDELDDVGKREFGEGALETHRGGFL